MEISGGARDIRGGGGGCVVYIGLILSKSNKATPTLTWKIRLSNLNKATPKTNIFKKK